MREVIEEHQKTTKTRKVNSLARKGKGSPQKSSTVACKSNSKRLGSESAGDFEIHDLTSSQETHITLCSSSSSDSSEDDFNLSSETVNQMRHELASVEFVSEERRAQLWKEICQEAPSSEETSSDEDDFQII